MFKRKPKLAVAAAGDDWMDYKPVNLDPRSFDTVVSPVDPEAEEQGTLVQWSGPYESHGFTLPLRWFWSFARESDPGEWTRRTRLINKVVEKLQQKTGIPMLTAIVDPSPKPERQRVHGASSSRPPEPTVFLRVYLHDHEIPYRFEMSKDWFERKYRDHDARLERLFEILNARKRSMEVRIIRSAAE